jgi:hypothetical protein
MGLILALTLAALPIPIEVLVVAAAYLAAIYAGFWLVGRIAPRL